MKAYIKAIDYYLPTSILTNDNLVVDFPEWSVEKIAKKVGINKRHLAAENETSLDMAVKAAENLFSNFNIPKEDIDFILFCTQSPDYVLPTSACIIQNRLALSTNIGALDFNLGCSGYIYGLALAKGLITSSVARNILLLTAETYTHYIHPKDKGNRTIFGDAATATIVSQEGFAEIGEFALGTDGNGAKNLIIKSGGARNPGKAENLEFDKDNNPISEDFLYMNGAEIFSFTQKNVPKVVKDTISKNHLTPDDINLYLFHQANSYLLEFLRIKMKIDKTKYIIDISETGNTVSNSIPLALARTMQIQRIKGNVLICGFGVGYSWGATILKFE